VAHIDNAAGKSDFEVSREQEHSETSTAAICRIFAVNAEVFTPNPRTLDENRIVAWNKRHPSTRAFDILRTKVLAEMKSKGWFSIAITSPAESCGKTTVALNLALSMAHQLGSNVALLDFDLRQPRVAAMLGMQPEVELGNYLQGGTCLPVQIITAGATQLRVVPSSGSHPNATELLGASKVDKLFAELKSEGTGRVGIFDLPPLLTTDDALSVLPRIDCALLVVGEGVTSETQVTDALNLLSGTNTLGVVLNQSRTSVNAYY